MPSPPPPTNSQATDAGLTLSEYFSGIAPSYWNEKNKEFPKWPPDAFAMVASALQRSGAYRRAVEEWPPAPGWEKSIAEIGIGWRMAWTKTASDVPEILHQWWNVVLSYADCQVSSICGNVDLCVALLQLSAAADESCRYVGMAHVSGKARDDYAFLHRAEVMIDRNQKDSQTPSCASLCDRIHVSRVRVLPKTRTTQRGLTIRSFTHHLSLCYASEVLPKWHITPRSGVNASKSFLNLLLIPWPTHVCPGHFSEIVTTPTVMHERFGMFRVHTGENRKLADHVTAAMEKAKSLIGPIDGVVFPEAAISPEEFNVLRATLRKDNVFLIAGVCSDPSGEKLMENYVSCAFPLDRTYVEHAQHKHHRWCLDRSQIINYGLSSRLDPNRMWWEGIDIKDRQLHFFALEQWLTTCVLICEDLARQDPVAELVRSIGPNLVISLLADGPQLRTRWPHQYAAVLSDDPGSSVLCMTSLGMTELSRPLDKQASSRVVALWKDSKTGAVEIALAPGATGVVLNLFHEKVEEFTADNRSDDRLASAIILGGIHQIVP